MLRAIVAVQTALQSPQIQEKAADTATGVAIVGAGFSWLSNANEVLTALATITAIIAGGFAARYHYKKTKLLEKVPEEKIEQLLSEDD